MSTESIASAVLRHVEGPVERMKRAVEDMRRAVEAMGRRP
jgi:hypothetical protein